MLVPDSALFYRAVQAAPDLYGSVSAFILPQVALQRRGQPTLAIRKSTGTA